MNHFVTHLKVFYAGRVQGVGFRYQTTQVAKEFEVSGFVKNLADGRVELQVEGAREDVMEFKAELERQMVDYIRSAEEQLGERIPEFKGFSIR